MTTYTIRRATEADVPTVVALWTESSQWLREKGSDQWQYPIKMNNVRSTIAARTCWIVERGDGEPVATVTLDENADHELWQPADEPDNALYLHRLVVRLDHRKHELGSAILDWASLRAQSQRKQWVRLDAWTSNEALHEYYRQHGFRHIRTVASPGVVSGATFERNAGDVVGRGPRISETDPHVPKDPSAT